jgi:hypothetical protein
MVCAGFYDLFQILFNYRIRKVTFGCPQDLFGCTQIHPNPRGWGGIEVDPSQTTWIGVELCAAKQALSVKRIYKSTYLKFSHWHWLTQNVRQTDLHVLQKLIII